MAEINENQEFETQIIETIDENGETVELELLDIVDVEGVEYAVLQEVEEDDEYDEDAEVEAVLMRLIRKGDKVTFETIDDDEEFNIVNEYITSLYAEED
ncbi:DUF1292 domain-containing protein [bacterium]|nr:DUF1292 domain-containing protein [bacterium]